MRLYGPIFQDRGLWHGLPGTEDRTEKTDRNKEVWYKLMRRVNMQVQESPIETF